MPTLRSLLGGLLVAGTLVVGLPTSAPSQTLPPNLPTPEQLANDNNLFLTLARKALKWEEPAEPARIVGPLYFVGTQGLGVFLFTTSRGTSS
jgi:metallo-beta-lactamase class B